MYMHRSIRVINNACVLKKTLKIRIHMHRPTLRVPAYEYAYVHSVDRKDDGINKNMITYTD